MAIRSCIQIQPPHTTITKSPVPTSYSTMDIITYSTVVSEVTPSSSLLTVDVDHATVNVVRSTDGIKNWEKSTANPIVAPEPSKDSWNCDAVYKPFVAYDEETGQWLMFYNGRCGGLER